MARQNSWTPNDQPGSVAPSIAPSAPVLRLHHLGTHPTPIRLFWEATLGLTL